MPFEVVAAIVVVDKATNKCLAFVGRKLRIKAKL